MIYQRHIPPDELFSAQLEMLMQNGRFGTVTLHFVGVLAALTLFWPYLGLTNSLLFCAVFLIFLLLRSMQMSNALVERSFQSQPRRVYWQLIFGTAVTGGLWSAIYISATYYVPVTMQYVFLLVIVMISAFSLSFSVIVREYFIVYLFSSLWPIAWWNLAHYQEESYNLLIGGALLAFCGLSIYVSEQIYQSFRNMISLNWEREHIAQELGGLTGSLRDRNRELRGARRQLTQLANVDELTGLGNRRVVNTVLKEEINRARRVGAELSVILLDVDFFKNYNDTYGHPAGDAVLQKLADVMQRATTRAGEVVARYGGEEFILILPGASAESALRTATRLQRMIEQEGIPHGTSEVSDFITISQGIVTVPPESEHDPSDVIRDADVALYKAKDEGRDTISVH